MFQKTEEFEVDGGERENPVEMEFAGGGDPSQAAPISDTGYCFPEGSGRGGRLERGVNGVVTELLMLRWIQVYHTSRTLKRGGMESRHNMLSLDNGGADAYCQ